MSYILDALKRADAERERGQVPGLHAHPLAESGSGARTAGLPRWALIGGASAGLLVVAALAWRMGADANAPLPAPMVAPPPAPTATVSTTPPPAETPPAAYEPVPSPAPRPVPKPAPEAVRPPSPGPVVSRAVTPPSPPGRIAPAPAPATEPTAPAATASIPTLAQLPASLRKQLPPLAVGGSVYSDDASARFIMLNGEVVKEGGQPAPDLVLERIEPKSAVLRFKGERFRLPY